MHPLERITIIACILIVGGVFGNYIYRKLKKLPTGECTYCSHKNNNLVKEFRKKYPKK